jgi:hypothetical protein
MVAKENRVKLMLEIIVPKSRSRNPSDWDASLPPAWILAEPLEKLRVKYCSGKWSPSADFDLYAAQRAQNRGWSDRIEGADLWATHLMNSRLKAAEADALLRHRAAIGRALEKVVEQDLSAGLRWTRVWGELSKSHESALSEAPAAHSYAGFARSCRYWKQERQFS